MQRTAATACTKIAIIVMVSGVTIAGCAGGPQSSATTSSSTSATSGTARSEMVKGSDGNEIGEYVGGRPAAGSKFARLKFGMSPQEVMNAIGAPADTTTHETGKRWIPFYFGPDARRTEVLYRGEGCLQYTGGNIYGSGSSELIVIETDPKGACFNS